MTRRSCDHYWLYEHTIYDGPRGEKDATCAIHRQCAKCRTHRMAVCETWRSPFAQYDLPELASKETDDGD